MNILNKIQTKKEYQGKSTLTSGNKYLVTIIYNGKQIQVDFNDNYLNKSGKKDFIFALLLDANAFDTTKNAIDFMEEFGYTEPQQAKEVYNACKESAKKLHYLFTKKEIEQLQQLFEDY